jgi:hypothetical protein
MRVTWAVTPIDFGSELIYRETLCTSASNQWKSLKPSKTYFKHGEPFYRYQYVLTAVIDNLRPECVYEYQLGNGIFWKSTRAFEGRTPFYNPPFDIEDLNYPATAIVMGDMGVGEYSSYSRKIIEEETAAGNYDFIIHLGDIAYDLDTYDGTIGNEYMREIESFASVSPYMVLPGNHEVPQNFTHYSNRFYMPRNWASQDTSLYYSFNLGRAHFVMYNSEALFYMDNEVLRIMKLWLEEDLAKANENRQEVPWLIVSAHKPLYCSLDYRYSVKESKKANNNNCDGQTRKMRKEFEELFFRNKVDIIIAGHVHNYERSSAIYKETPIPCDIDVNNYQHNCHAPIHIVTGNAGNDHIYEPLTQTPQDWYRSGTGTNYGFGKLYIYNSTHIYWEQFNSEAGVIADYLWLSKDRVGYTTSS